MNQKDLEVLMMNLVGEIPTEPLPKKPWEYYWMLLCGETPGAILPNRPLGYYLCLLTGVEFIPESQYPEEYLLQLLIGETPSDTLPKRTLDYYLQNYVPSGFRLRFDEDGNLVLFGEEPLPEFTLDADGILNYDDSVPGTPTVDQVSMTADGIVMVEE